MRFWEDAQRSRTIRCSNKDIPIDISPESLILAYQVIFPARDKSLVKVCYVQASFLARA